jgi:hypothetical protein
LPVALGANSTDLGRSNVVPVGSDAQQRRIVNVARATHGIDAANLNPLNIVASSVQHTMQNQQVQINALGSAPQQTDSMAAPQRRYARFSCPHPRCPLPPS